MLYISEIISAIRRSGVTYRVVAQKCGVSQALVDKIMAGTHRNITLSTAEKLTKGLARIERSARRPPRRKSPAPEPRP